MDPARDIPQQSQPPSHHLNEEVIQLEATIEPIITEFPRRVATGNAKPGSSPRRSTWLIVCAVLAIVLTPFALLVALCVGLFVLLSPSMSETMRRHWAFESSISDYAPIPDLDKSILDIEPVPKGYIRGKYVLVEPLTPLGPRLHPYYSDVIDDARMAESPDEVETVIWVQETYELVGEYSGRGGGNAYDKVVTLTVIDLPNSKIVGRFEVRGEAPKVIYSRSSSKLGYVRYEDLQQAIAELPSEPSSEEEVQPGASD